VAIYPTPVIGMVGVVEDVDHLTGHAFAEDGDAILLLGENLGEMGGSEYLYVMDGEVAGTPPEVDLLAERRLQHAVLAMIQQVGVRSAHDCSEGGLALALAECALADEEAPRGVDVDLDDDLAPIPLLFGESQGRVVVSCAPDVVEDALRMARRHGVPAREIGRVGEVGGPFRIRTGEAGVDLDSREMARLYYGAIPGIMDAVPDSRPSPAHASP
jgi:phosphoribosylformylglycinamidine synthase